LDTSLHHAEKSPNAICLLGVCFAEPLKPVQQFRASLAAILELVFYVVEERLELAVNFE
jgi:hypothetical protein